MKIYSFFKQPIVAAFLIICFLFLILTKLNAARATGLQTAASTVTYVPGQKLLASDKATADQFGTAVAISRDGQVLVVGAPRHAVSGQANRGQVYVYQRSGNRWTEARRLTASDGASGDKFGAAVAVAGAPNYEIVVGAPLHDSGGYTDLGAAYLYSANGGLWSVETTLPVSDTHQSSYNLRGSSVAITDSSSYIFVGAPGVQVGSDQPGAVYRFTQFTAVWYQAQRIEGPTGGKAELGRSMALSDDGSMLLVSGLYAPSGPLITYGAVYLYEWTAGGFYNYGDMLTPSDGAELDGFGKGLAVADDEATLLIGAPGNGAGHAYLFTASGATWSEDTILTRPDSFYGNFGQSVQLDGVGETAAIGAWLNGSGAVHLFAKEPGGWSHRRTLTTPDGRQEALGYDIAMSRNGDMIAGGARAAHSNTTVYDTVGAVYTFIPGFEAFLPLIIR